MTPGDTYQTKYSKSMLSSDMQKKDTLTKTKIFKPLFQPTVRE